MKISAFRALLLAAAPLLCGAAPLPGQTCHLPGMEEALRCVRLDLPSDYARSNGAKIALHITVAAAFREAARPDPLFILAGGPGQAGSDILPLLNTSFRRVRATRDIVVIDQRGTGLSGKLDCPMRELKEDASEEDAVAILRRCIDTSHVPFADYSTLNAARDVEQVRLALGYPRINLWGGSYGTRLAQAYARLYPSTVRALVLDGVAEPEQIIPAGAHDAQAALDALLHQCESDQPCATAFPQLRNEFSTLLERTGKGRLMLELADPRTAAPTRIPMTRTRFVSTVHNILYSPIDSRRLPFLVHAAYGGRWGPFVARSNVASDFSAEPDVSMLLHLAVTCAEDLPRLTEAALAQDEQNTFLGDAMVSRYRKVCAVLPLPPAPQPATTPIAAPVLMLSGALDPVTPPRRAVSAARHMQHVQHFVVANAGHGISQLGCAPRLLREFLDQPAAPLKASCLNEIPMPTFQLGSAGPQP